GVAWHRLGGGLATPWPVVRPVGRDGGFRHLDVPRLPTNDLTLSQPRRAATGIRGPHRRSRRGLMVGIASDASAEDDLAFSLRDDADDLARRDRLARHDREVRDDSVPV